jgi:hypothetical protein
MEINAFTSGIPSVQQCHLQQRFQDPTTCLHAKLPRRDFQKTILSTLLSSALAAASGKRFGFGEAAAADPSKKVGPLADLPMIRLKLPSGGFGREYVALKLMVQNQGPFDFMVDSGLTTEFITPHLQAILGILEGKDRISGLAAGGETASNALVPLAGAALCCGDFADSTVKELPLPQMNAVITDFPQEHLDPSHDPVEGMLGMELLQLFDVDFDFPKNRIRFWKAGTADTSGLTEIPAVVINESLLIGIRVSTPEGNGQPIIGFLDCGSTFSCMNWKAAQALGLPPRTDPSYLKGPAVSAVGIDGKPLVLPTIRKQLSFAGDIIVDPNTRRPLGFEKPPSDWRPWDPVQVAVGDIPVFSSILGDGVTPYEGPAALIGLDILSQRRIVLEAGTGNSRARKVAVSPA